MSLEQDKVSDLLGEYAEATPERRNRIKTELRQHQRALKAQLDELKKGTDRELIKRVKRYESTDATTRYNCELTQPSPRSDELRHLADDQSYYEQQLKTVRHNKPDTRHPSVAQYMRIKGELGHIDSVIGPPSKSEIHASLDKGVFEPASRRAYGIGGSQTTLCWL